MRQFSPIVDALVLSVFDARHDFAFGRPVALELVGHDNPGDIVQPLEQLAEETLGGGSGHVGIEPGRQAYICPDPPSARDSGACRS